LSIGAPDILAMTPNTVHTGLFWSLQRSC